MREVTKLDSIVSGRPVRLPLFARSQSDRKSGIAFTGAIDTADLPRVDRLHVLVALPVLGTFVARLLPG